MKLSRYEKKLMKAHYENLDHKFTRLLFRLNVVRLDVLATYEYAMEYMYRTNMDYLRMVEDDIEHKRQSMPKVPKNIKPNKQRRF